MSTHEISSLSKQRHLQAECVAKCFPPEGELPSAAWAILGRRLMALKKLLSEMRLPAIYHLHFGVIRVSGVALRRMRECVCARVSRDTRRNGRIHNGGGSGTLRGVDITNGAGCRRVLRHGFCPHNKGAIKQGSERSVPPINQLRSGKARRAVGSLPSQVRSV